MREPSNRSPGGKNVIRCFAGISARGFSSLEERVVHRRRYVTDELAKTIGDL